jgi:hypothetical protein
MSDDINCTRDLWSEGVKVAWNHLPQIDDEKSIRDLWFSPDRHFTPKIADHGSKNELDELARDPEVLKELAKSDPKLHEQLVDAQIEEVAVAFRNQTPLYARTGRNYSSIVQYLAKRYLKADHLDDSEATFALCEKGFWTVETLSEAYGDLLRKGHLDVPANQAKQLTSSELLECIAVLRAEGPVSAIALYLKLAVGQDVRQTDYKKVMVAYPEAARKAVCTIWFHNRAGMDRAVFQDFVSKKVSRMVMPSMALLDAAWAEYLMERMDRTEQEQHRPREVSPDEMDDAQIADALREARREHATSRRRA